MLYLLIYSATATPYKYYNMTSNTTTTESTYKYLSFVVISQVYLQSQGYCCPKYFPKIFLNFLFVKIFSKSS